jgi:hypothetical protein
MVQEMLFCLRRAESESGAHSCVINILKIVSHIQVKKIFLICFQYVLPIRAPSHDNVYYLFSPLLTPMTPMTPLTPTPQPGYFQFSNSAVSTPVDQNGQQPVFIFPLPPLNNGRGNLQQNF